MARAALFDVDGTLVDTNYLHVTAWWEAFRQAGHDVPMQAVHHAVGLGSDDLMDHLLGTGRDHEEGAAISTAHKVLYGQYFERLPALDAAGDLLRTLAARGWTVVLATSASGPELDALRKALDADDVIADTAGAEDVDEGKPAPEPVERARRLAGATREDSVYVGDSVWDMEAATRAGVPVIGLLSGGIPRADLENAGAAEIYRDPADLLARLDESLFGSARRDG
ncbi:HAD family hydrolase [Streptomyces sp. AM 4-1-1]|uniref:HAD family hydrolase n=1 Tax=Streptomyces sp. AM 4-1-1 TaxID=3028710 RepID=UPI0023B98D5C|nr:HAD family hydrolase [Streptomyces sp. AM 4-1-1]WEH32029.1 HAD family hydrolase [Streptomyces sp. AM 4-1-1]